MIFVTVGNATQGFQRLLSAVEDCLEKGIFAGKDIFVQTGNNPDFNSQQFRYKPFLSMDEFQQWMEKADLIITHAGCGTLLHAIRLGKTPVVMPRRREYNEIINDHQLQLVQALVAEGRIVPVYEPEDLPHAVAEARKRAGQPISLSPPPMLKLIENAIHDLIKASK